MLLRDRRTWSQRSDAIADKPSYEYSICLGRCETAGDGEFEAATVGRKGGAAVRNMHTEKHRDDVR